MALWACLGCTTRYAVGAPRCPQCSSTDHVEEGHDDMPKITVHGGPSIDTGDLDAPGEGESSPGTSSSTSSEKDETSTEQSEPTRGSRARTTASRSKKAQTGSSSAGGTDGGQTARTSAKTSDDDKK